MKTYFFTSYARVEERAWVRRFHNDLEREIRVRRGPFTEGCLAAPGGASVHAAATSPAMVALVSHAHLRDRRCGREWAIFAERLALHPQVRDLCLIPVQWKPLNPETRLPMIMHPLPAFWTSAGAGPYTASGLYGLMRARALDGPGGYYAVVRAVAALVFEAAQAGLGPLDEATAAATGPAFGVRDATEEPVPVPGPAEAGELPRTVAISYVGPDQPWAEYLGNLLRTNDYEVELVRWNAGRAERLRDSVARARDSGERVVAVLSQNSVAPHMEALVREDDLDWEQALGAPPGRSAPVIPVQVDSGPLPGGLSERAIPMHGLDESVIRTLLDALRRSA
nr:hypothetical protein GCM10010200_022530 [Actinomadura rugatobispora]